ncbi:SCO family protein [Metabacillus malikii]|uniref:Protein SCO1/2 n=1 Tax=Metabacillus malikii TaxID=1504265 RepID=A0ABT9ZC77_9BACI|nr:SCO family protein [Metabacillus malikii]MDQ0228875.1 protein SCO1/2 [Metabacillus malikii]
MSIKKNKLFIFIMIITMVGLTACSTSAPISNPLNYEVQSFQYNNQDGETVSLSELKGTVWLANFVFTNCETVCPPMTAHMKELQNKMKAEGLNAKIISFSVDPEVDTPEKIKEFTKTYDISFDDWEFLTGYTQEEIENFAKKSFKALVKKPNNHDQVMHKTSFYLVDQNGVVMRDYSGAVETPYDEIISDIKLLLK